MNPHSTLSDEIFGIELRDRVTACRKRVRRNRVMQKLDEASNQVDTLFAEPDSSISQVHQYTEEYSEVVVANLVEKQEVGIT